MKIAYQGTKGAYSEMAIYKFFGQQVQAIGYNLSEQVCEAVAHQKVDMGVFPVENSIVGNVYINSDLLYKNNFSVIYEIYLPIKHCLLAKPGSKLKDIKKVYSHPVALEQCRSFLNKHRIKAIPDFDTAGASKSLLEKNSNNEATISSSLCATYYNLKILNDNIQANKNNFTRFLVFVTPDKIPLHHKQEKTSLAFTVKHHPGALLKCLETFANYNINLTKLESRPIPENPFAYIFFVDFSEPLNSNNVQDCLLDLSKDTQSIKILGSYPQGTR